MARHGSGRTAATPVNRVPRRTQPCQVRADPRGEGSRASPQGRYRVSSLSRVGSAGTCPHRRVSPARPARAAPLGLESHGTLVPGTMSRAGLGPPRWGSQARQPVPHSGGPAASSDPPPSPLVRRFGGPSPPRHPPPSRRPPIKPQGGGPRKARGASPGFHSKTKRQPQRGGPAASPDPAPSEPLCRAGAEGGRIHAGGMAARSRG